VLRNAYMLFPSASHNPEDNRGEKACAQDGESTPASLKDLVLTYDWIGLGACTITTFILLRMTQH
jgi:hypothetical protein